jgi:hypothetical protein
MVNIQWRLQVVRALEIRLVEARTRKQGIKMQLRLQERQLRVIESVCTSSSRSNALWPTAASRRVFTGKYAIIRMGGVESGKINQMLSIVYHGLLAKYLRSSTCLCVGSCTTPFVWVWASEFRCLCVEA